LKETGTKINMLIYDCTPVSEADVLNQDIGDLRLLEALGMKHGMGFAGKLAGDLWDTTESSPNRCLSLKQQVEYAWQTTVSGISEDLCISELNMVVDSNLRSFTENLRSVDYNSITYLCAADDTVVDDKSAAQKIRAANKLAKDRPFTEVTLEGLQHASAMRHPYAYNAALAPLSHGKPAVSVSDYATDSSYMCQS
jgi:hypothetical protein